MEQTENEINYSRVNESQGESTFNRVKITLAEQLSRAAQVLHQKSAQDLNPQELSSIGHRAADWLERSAGYVREVEPQRLRADLEDQVRRNPGRSLLIAGLAGVVVGRILRRG